MKHRLSVIGRRHSLSATTMRGCRMFQLSARKINPRLGDGGRSIRARRHPQLQPWTDS
jgi:hypothetical protein